MIINEYGSGSVAANDPSAYRSRVLLAVSGLSPQIITETIYWLACQRKPAFVPTRIVVMSTTEGAAQVRLLLQSENPGWLARLIRDYDLPPVPLAVEDLRIITDAAGKPLDDLRTAEDNTAAANAIVTAVAELTRDPDSALHVSIAGGRKTQGFFAGYALSLYGREQDRMSHVLVSNQFETHREFFYPTPYSCVIMTRDDRPLDCRDAKVMLADLPFVRMREGLSEALRTGRTSYAEAVDAVQGRLAPPRLVIDIPSRRVTAGRQAVPLAPSLLAFYAWLARRTIAGQPWIEKGGWEDCAKKRCDAQDYLRESARMVLLDERESTKDFNNNGISAEVFRSMRAKLNRRLHTSLVDPQPERYQVASQRRRGRSAYGLALPAEAITIID